MVQFLVEFSLILQWVIYEIITQEQPWKGIYDCFHLTFLFNLNIDSPNNMFLINIHIELKIWEAAMKVQDGYRMTIPQHCYCPLALKLLMERCWAQNPIERPDFEEICKYLGKMDEQGNIKSSSLVLNNTQNV